MSTAVAVTERRLAWVCVVATALTALAWPSNPKSAAWIAPVLALLPLIPLLLALCFRLGHTLYYAGLGMLIYFSHGAMEAYVTPQTRFYAAAEIFFTLGYFGLLLLIRKRGKESQAKLAASMPSEGNRNEK